MSLSEQEIEQQLRAKGKSAPRITPEHVDAAIVGRQVTLIENTMVIVVVLTLYNGFIVTGVNHGPVDPDNFDAEIGARLAFDAARDKVWELEGYLLADRLHKAAGGAALPHYGTDIEQIDGSADIVREPVSADGYSTSEGANVHGIGPHTDGGDNPEYVEAVGPDGKTFSEAVAEVPLATDPTTQPATFVKVGKNERGEFGELSSDFPFTDETTDGKLLRNDGAIVDEVVDAEIPPTSEPQG